MNRALVEAAPRGGGFKLAKFRKWCKQQYHRSVRRWEKWSPEGAPKQRRFIGCFVLALLLAPPSWAIQCVRPTSDEDNSTYFWDVPGSGSQHYSYTNEDAACTYTSTAGSTIQEDDGSVYRAHMGNPADPEVSTGHIWTCRGYISSNKAHTFTCDIYQGSTKLNTATACTTSSWTSAHANLQCTLTGTEADAITDYSDLRIYATATAANPTDVFIETLNIEVPNAPAGARSRVHVIGD